MGDIFLHLILRFHFCKRSVPPSEDEFMTGPVFPRLSSIGQKEALSASVGRFSPVKEWSSDGFSLFDGRRGIFSSPFRNARGSFSFPLHAGIKGGCPPFFFFVRVDRETEGVLSLSYLGGGVLRGPVTEVGRRYGLLLVCFFLVALSRGEAWRRFRCLVRASRG